MIVAGTCLGPAIPGYVPGTDEGAWVVAISFRKTNGDVTLTRAHVNGGGLFLPYPDEGLVVPRRVTVLARFQDLQHKPAAAVRCRVGERGGVAVLSSLHLERPVTRGAEDCFRQLLLHGGLSTREGGGGGGGGGVVVGGEGGTLLPCRPPPEPPVRFG